MSDLVQATFDYGALDEVRRVRVQVRAESIRARMKRTAEDIIAIGQDLIEVKKDLEHGQFLQWLKDEFDMSRQTADNFIHVAERFSGKLLNFSNLSVSVLYALAAPSTPDTVIKQVQSGEIPATLDAIKAAKEAERQAEEKVKKIEQESLLALMLADDRVNEAQMNARLLEEQVEAKQSEIASLKRQITDLSQEYAEPQIITREVVPPDIQQNLADLEKKLREAERSEKKLKEERDEKASLLLQKTERIKILTEEIHKYDAQTQEQKRVDEIRLRWRQCYEAFHSGLGQAVVRIVSPIDAQMAFESDDWARLAEVEAMLRQSLERLAQMRERVANQFIDASMAYVEA